MMPEQQQRILGYFIEEAKDHLNTLEQGLLNLQSTISDPEMVNEVFRAAHSVKGGAAMLGIGSIQRSAHRLEDYFKILKESPLRVDRALESMLLRVFDGLNALIEELQGPFGLTEDKAQEVMTGLEPVFGQLEHHLQKLVDASSAVTKQEMSPPASTITAAQSSSQPPVASPSRVESALKLVFKSDVPSHLREMLALFKQPDTLANREALKSCCDDLTRIGEQFDLYAWSELSLAAYQAIQNPQTTYRSLAPVIIKELKTAQEQVLRGQGEAISVGEELRSLMPTPAQVEETPPDIDFLLAEPLAAEASHSPAEATDLEGLFSQEEPLMASDASTEDTLDWLIAPASEPTDSAAGLSQNESALAAGSDDWITESFEDASETGEDLSFLADVDTPETDSVPLESDLFSESFLNSDQPVDRKEEGFDDDLLSVLSPNAAVDSDDDFFSEALISPEDTQEADDLDSLLETAAPGTDTPPSEAEAPTGAAALNAFADLFEGDMETSESTWEELPALAETGAAETEPFLDSLETITGDASSAVGLDDLLPPDPLDGQAPELSSETDQNFDALFDSPVPEPSPPSQGESLEFETDPELNDIDLPIADETEQFLSGLNAEDGEDGASFEADLDLAAWPDTAVAGDEPSGASPDIDATDFNLSDFELNTVPDLAVQTPDTASETDLDPETPWTFDHIADPWATEESPGETIVADADTDADALSALDELGLTSEMSSVPAEQPAEADDDFAVFESLGLEESLQDNGAGIVSPHDETGQGEALEEFDLTRPAVDSQDLFAEDDLSRSAELDQDFFADPDTPLSPDAEEEAGLGSLDFDALLSTEAAEGLPVEDPLGDKPSDRPWEHSDLDALLTSEISLPDPEQSTDGISPDSWLVTESALDELDLADPLTFEGAPLDHVGEPAEVPSASDFAPLEMPQGAREPDLEAPLFDFDEAQPESPLLEETDNQSNDLDLGPDLLAEEDSDDFFGFNALAEGSPAGDEPTAESDLSFADNFETSVPPQPDQSSLDALFEPSQSATDTVAPDELLADDDIDEFFGASAPPEALAQSSDSDLEMGLADSDDTEMFLGLELADSASEPAVTPLDGAVTSTPGPEIDFATPVADAPLLDSDGLFEDLSPHEPAAVMEPETPIDTLSPNHAWEEFDPFSAEPEPQAASSTPLSEADFDDLDGLLNDDISSQLAAADIAEPVPSSTFDDLDDLLNDEPGESQDTHDFDGLDALLADTPDADAPLDADEDFTATAHSAPVNSEEMLPEPADTAGAIDEFSDLEKLLEEADQTLGGSPARTTSGNRPTHRRGGMVDQTMRVSVKHLDTLNNLVGELVVNRNSLEQDQERLRQFLDNLLFQVQQLNDVGQRMRDLYERSLLESSLMSNRQVLQGTGGRSREGKGGRGDTDHATGAKFDALELDRFTGFHTLSQEMIELIVRVRESASDIGYTVESADQVTRQFRQVTSQLQEGLNKARMVPFAQTADRLPRAVRDISLKCGKEARLFVEGRDTLIDKMILERLYDPMTHLVNNAITHGIESPEERTSLGKSREGTITVRAFYQGNQTVIYIADDGAGINPDVVKRKAIKKGLLTQAEANAMTVLETYELLFRPGFSTRDRADDFAGRGVGMDVVRTALSEIRGSITIDSELGQGTSFTIRLPLTLSISKALSCLNNQARIAFPMDGVEDMFDVPRDRIQVDDTNQSSIPWRDMQLSFQPLSELLQFNRSLGRGRVYGGSNDEDMVSIVVLRSANNYIGIQVDRVLGEQEIVIKQLEGPVPKPMGIAGATVLGDGRVMPIADVLELIDIAQGRVRREANSSLWTQTDESPEPTAVEAKAEPTVLIVDDSITVRELLSMSFGKVGYRVEQARDGQEAWEKLRSGLPCDLVFCDIEMPRMDGLELLSRIQKDTLLKQIPIAMLTSRGADRHRQMAMDLGANGYFTKPYLEEALLDAAQRMLEGEVLLSQQNEAETSP